jgi:RNA polymerase sigma-70 factor (ECF subfamily)
MTSSPRERSRAELERWFDELLAAYGASLGRLAASYTRSSAEREDLVQEIALAIWSALPGFRGECSERTFFFRIAHNRALAHVARRRLPVAESETLPEVEDATPDPEKTLSGEQQGQLLMAAIRRLPVAHAQVVTLMLEGMTYQEIADVLGISETNVGARLTRGREMLRRLLRNANAG